MTSIYQKALDKWGETSQVLIATGECGELIAETTRHYLQQKSTLDAFISELADVSIVMEQMQLLFETCRINNEIKQTPPVFKNLTVPHCAVLTSQACAVFIAEAVSYYIEQKENHDAVLSAVAIVTVRVDEMKNIVGAEHFDIVKSKKLSRLEAIIDGRIEHPHKIKAS
ncbi:hypothetical protein ACPV5O_21060 [Vibrio maritimus]|uniref:hypothetical protein n=1 Tax=Vibrio maritimus TaxID=990268 RepID=UPI00406800BE